MPWPPADDCSTTPPYTNPPPPGKFIQDLVFDRTAPDATITSNGSLTCRSPASLKPGQGEKYCGPAATTLTKGAVSGTSASKEPSAPLVASTTLPPPKTRTGTPAAGRISGNTGKSSKTTPRTIHEPAGAGAGGGAGPDGPAGSGRVRGPVIGAGSLHATLTASASTTAQCASAACASVVFSLAKVPSFHRTSAARKTGLCRERTAEAPFGPESKSASACLRPGEPLTSPTRRDCSSSLQT
jgi:hypothetical protein